MPIKKRGGGEKQGKKNLSEIDRKFVWLVKVFFLFERANRGGLCTSQAFIFFKWSIRWRCVASLPDNRDLVVVGLAAGAFFECLPLMTYDVKLKRSPALNIHGSTRISPKRDNQKLATYPFKDFSVMTVVDTIRSMLR